MKVAHFPWDPPEPEQQRLPPTGSAQPQKAVPGQMNMKPDATAGYQQQQNGVRIKSEPGLEHSQNLYGVAPIAPAGHPMGNATHDPQIAQMRAQQNIAQKFGPQLQARPQNNGLVLPGMAPQQQQQYHYQQQLQHQQRQAQSQINGMQHPQQQQQRQIPQHDGADDSDDEPIVVDGFGSLTREQADRILIKRLEDANRKGAEASAELAEALKQMNMKPRKGKSKARRRVKRQDAYEAALDPSTNYPHPSSPSTTGSLSLAGPSIPQLDGDGSEHEEADEDAINSDLDDPNEEELESDEDAEVPQIMLCMYDKVQRTKNKWKCVLKDGVLTINGKE